MAGKEKSMEQLKAEMEAAEAKAKAAQDHFNQLKHKYSKRALAAETKRLCDLARALESGLGHEVKIDDLAEMINKITAEAAPAPKIQTTPPPMSEIEIAKAAFWDQMTEDLGYINADVIKKITAFCHEQETGTTKFGRTPKWISQYIESH